MREKRVLRRHLWLLCAMSLAASRAVGSAQAGDWDTVLFGSLDAGAAAFLTTGVKVAPGGFDGDGFVLLASAGIGRRDERGMCGCTRIPVTRTRTTILGAALVGYQWVSEWGVAALFAGPEGSVETLSGASGNVALPGRWGVRLHGEIWARPTSETLLQATAIVSSARESLWARLGWGWRIWGAYLGPEAGLYADRTGYRKWNLGLHATDFAVGDYSLRISAGLQLEPDRSPGPYVALVLWTPL